MQDQCHSGKWPEDEMRAKRLCKQESARWVNGETYRSPVRASSCGKTLSTSRLVSKGATMGDTQDKMIIKNNGVSLILDAKKGQNKSMISYLKSKSYAPEGTEAITNIQGHKQETSDKKE